MSRLLGAAASSRRALEALRSMTRRNPLCVAVADAADFEGSIFTRSAKILLQGSTIILAINKTDRLPRVEEQDLRYFQNWYTQRRLDVGMDDNRPAFGVSALTGQGIDTLADEVLRLRQGRDVILCGMEKTGKSLLADKLAEEFAARRLVHEGSFHVRGPEGTRLLLPFDEQTALWDIDGLHSESLVCAQLPESSAERLRARLHSEQGSVEMVEEPLRLLPGESVLLEMAQPDDSLADATPPIVLARIDVSEASDPAAGDDPTGLTSHEHTAGITSSGSLSIEAKSFLSAAVSMRVVPTNEASDEAVVMERGAPRGLARKLPVAPHASQLPAVASRTRLECVKTMPTPFYRFVNGHSCDLHFAGLGFLTLHRKVNFFIDVYTLGRKCFSYRKPLYPRFIWKQYEPHLPIEESVREMVALTHRTCDARIANGELLERMLTFKSPSFAFGCTIGGEDEHFGDVSIRSSASINRALPGDIVAIRVLDQPKEAIDDAGHTSDDEAATGVTGASQEEEATDLSASRPELAGEVVSILERPEREFTALVSTQGSQMIASPRDFRLPRCILNPLTTFSEQADLVGQLALLKITGWEPRRKFPTAELLRVLGPQGDAESERDALLYEFQLAEDGYPAEALACLPDSGWQIPADEIARRTDLRHKHLFSVDPPGAMDIDDVLHAVELSPGRYEVGVHIADVGYFIKEGSALDKEAARRATTCYLVDSRVEMLPKLLSQDLCSLHSNVDRLAFSVFWEMDEGANVVKPPRFERTVIRSVASLTYADAQSIIDDKSKDDEVAQGLRRLSRLAKRLRKKRLHQGALQLDSPDLTFTLDPETGLPTSMELYQMRDTNHMIEEFMLLANVSVGKHIHEAFPDSAMLRQHPAPNEKSFDRLNLLVKQFGFSFDVSTPLKFQNSVNACVLRDDPTFNQLVRLVALRLMQRASYFSAGSVKSKADFFHFGLATPIYTHFTSPIRRYADQIVHRMLASSLKLEPEGDALRKGKRISEIAKVCNERSFNAKEAERKSQELHTLLFCRGRNIEEIAYVTQVKANGLELMIPRLGLESFMHVDTDAVKSRSCENPDPISCTIAASDGEIFEVRLFSRLRVRLIVDSSKHRPKVEFELLEAQGGIVPDIEKDFEVTADDIERLRSVGAP